MFSLGLKGMSIAAVVAFLIGMAAGARIASDRGKVALLEEQAKSAIEREAVLTQRIEFLDKLVSAQAAAAVADARVIAESLTEIERLRSARRAIETGVSAGVCFPEPDARVVRGLWRDRRVTNPGAASGRPR